MRTTIIAMTGALIFGCTTARSIPDRVDLVTIAPTSERIVIVDQRPPGARGARLIEASGTFSFFGDEAIHPSPVDLLSSRIAAAAPKQYRETDIVLTRMDIGYLRTSTRVTTTNQQPFIVASGAPASVNIVGNLLGHGLVELIRTTMPVIRDSAVVNIEIRVGGYDVATLQVIPIRQETRDNEVLEKALADGFRNLAEKVDAMQYWESPVDKRPRVDGAP